MSISHIESFMFDGKRYHHSICTETDAVSLYDGDDNILLTYNSDAAANTPDGAYYGRFSFKNYPNWSWQDADGSGIKQYGKDLLKAEIEVSKMFLKQNTGEITWA
jgi:hypothetical protein